MDGDSTADCGDVTVPLTVTICTTGRRSDWEICTGDAANAAGDADTQSNRTVLMVGIACFMVRRSVSPPAAKRNRGQRYPGSGSCGA